MLELLMILHIHFQVKYAYVQTQNVKQNGCDETIIYNITVPYGSLRTLITIKYKKSRANGLNEQIEAQGEGTISGMCFIQGI